MGKDFYKPKVLGHVKRKGGRGVWKGRDGDSGLKKSQGGPKVEDERFRNTREGEK